MPDTRKPVNVIRPIFSVSRLTVWDLGRSRKFFSALQPETGLNPDTSLHVAAYPLARRIQLAGDDIYRGFDYVRWVLNVPHHNGEAHDARISDFAGNHERHVGSAVQCQKQRRTGEILFIAADNIPLR